MDGSEDDSDSPSSENTSKPLAAWETADNDEVDKAQAANTFDLSTLFNFSPRKGNGSGSGYDDQISQQQLLLVYERNPQIPPATATKRRKRSVSVDE